MASFMKLTILVIYLASTYVTASYLDDIISDGYQDEILDARPLTRHKRSNFFSGHDPEGEEVLNRLNTIMSNSSISERSKQMLEAAIGNIGSSDASSSPGRSNPGRIITKSHAGLSNTHFRSSIGAPAFMLTSLLVPSIERTPTLHATECCCKVNMPPLTERRPIQVQRLRFNHKTVRAGYRPCGWWGWGRCTQYRQVLESHPYTATIYHIVHTPRPCPSDKEVCCRGYVAYKRCCTNIREMKRLLDLFERQRDQFESLRMFLISQGHNPDAGCPLSCGP